MQRWVLDREDGSVSSGTDQCQLSPRATEILAFMIGNSGTVLPRNKILAEVWQGLHVSPDLVREYIFEIRKALGDSASEPQFIETVGRRGYRLIGPVTLKPAGAASKTAGYTLRPDRLNRAAQMSGVRYCTSKDGTSIAHAVSGEGYPLLFAGSWMTHLVMDWESPAYGDYVAHLSGRFRVIRYDQRGNGLSQWANTDIVFDRLVDDMECVIDTYGHDQVAILGMSQGASVAIAYAQRHPDRVSHLILNGGYARGRRMRGNARDIEESDALIGLIRTCWGNDNPAVRQTLTTLFMPDATKEQMQWFNDFQKLCGPSENIADFRSVFDEVDVVGMLPKTTVPTLVLHSSEDAVSPLTEGKLLASQIPGAAFVELDSPNHLLFESEKEFGKMLKMIEEFAGP